MEETFYKYLEFERRSSNHTLISYKTDLDQFKKFYNNLSNSEEIANADKRSIRSWIIELSLNNNSKKTINRKIATLKSYYKFLIKRGIIRNNPTNNIKSLKTDQNIPKFLKENDLAIAFDNLRAENNLKKIRDILILEILYGTGIRISELINLKTKNINKDKREIKVLGKRGMERIIPLHDSLFSQIINYISLKEKSKITNREFLFCTEKGEKIYPMLISRVVKKNLSKLIQSEKYNPHLLRHTFATHILNKGADLSSIKELLGHKSLAATQIYTHNSIEKLKETFNKAHPKA
tara:strand:+ start:5308 stop:6186 length:879 start_codon:yes stop_codon:yes gene_type:complete